MTEEESKPIITRAIPEHIKRVPIYHEFWKRIYQQDKMVLLVIVGEPGSRKTGCSITIAKDFDVDYKGRSRFKIGKQLTSHAKDFLDIIQSGLPKGSVIIWDDCGIENDNREFISLRNRYVKKVMQTVRASNYLIIMTLPDVASLDIGSRRLLKGMLEMNEDVESNDYAVGKFFWVKTWARSGDIIYQYIRVTKDNLCFLVKEFEIEKPPKELWDEYFAYKEKTRALWYATFSSELAYMNNYLNKQADITLEARAEELLTSVANIVYDAKKQRFDPVAISVCLKQQGLEITDTMATKLARVLNVKRRMGLIETPLLETKSEGSITQIVSSGVFE